MNMNDPSIGNNPEEMDGDLGKRLTDILSLMVRRRWVIASTFCLVTLLTIVVLLYLPNRYTSEAMIFAVQQRVPERYVVPTTNVDPSQALEAMVQEVLSRPRLLAIIDELRLYSQRTGLQSDELIKLIRKDLKVEPLERMLSSGEVNAFKVSFVAETPELAHAVTQKLTTLFIEQNLKTRSDQAETTSEFLQEQLVVARQDLVAHEQRLRDYKMQFLGQLPEQQVGNLGILTSLHSQLDNLMASRNQAQQQRLYLESLLSQYEQHSRTPAAWRSATGEIVTRVQQAEVELSRLKAERTSLLGTYTPQHPDVLKKDLEISIQVNWIEELRSPAAAAPGKPDVPVDAPADSEQSIVVAQMRSQLLANKMEVENLNAKEKKLRTDIAQYQSRLNMTPVREQQLTSIQRDYDLVKQHYGDLLKKEQESQLAKDLEKRQEGQQFRLADPPNLPTMPSSPDRIKFSLIGLLGGLIVGCGLAFLLELRSPSIHSEKEAGQFDLPMVVGIPLLLTRREERARSWMHALEWCAALILLCLVALAEFYVYLHG